MKKLSKNLANNDLITIFHGDDYRELWFDSIAVLQHELKKKLGIKRWKISHDNGAGTSCRECLLRKHSYHELVFIVAKKLVRRFNPSEGVTLYLRGFEPDDSAYRSPWWPPVPAMRYGYRDDGTIGILDTWDAADD